VTETESLVFKPHRNFEVAEQLVPLKIHISHFNAAISSRRASVSSNVRRYTLAVRLLDCYMPVQQSST